MPPSCKRRELFTPLNIRPYNNAVLIPFADTELGSVLTTVSANDVDTSPTLTYAFVEGHRPEETAPFTIDRYSGRVVLRQPLDYETKQEYLLQISASDSAHVAHTTLTIRVVDVNDNAPLFQQAAYHVQLPGECGSNWLLFMPGILLMICVSVFFF